MGNINWERSTLCESIVEHDPKGADGRVLIMFKITPERGWRRSDIFYSLRYSYNKADDSRDSMEEFGVYSCALDAEVAAEYLLKAAELQVKPCQ